MTKSILILDDEEGIRRDLGNRLRARRYAVHTASSVDEAKKIILSERLDYAIVDLKIDWESEFGGAQVVNAVKRHQPRAKAIVLSAWPLNEEIRSKFEVEIDGYVEKGGQENYITAVSNTLDKLSEERQAAKCFVIMPFSDTPSCTSAEWTEVFREMIKPAVEKAGLGYCCCRSAVKMGNIIEDILDNLNRSDVVIADLTDRNPNVFYELGVRHALRHATILISQRLDDIPFDLRPLAIHSYDWKTREGRKAFRLRMKELLMAIESGAADACASPVRKYLRL